MKELDVLNAINRVRIWFRPSRVLGLLLCIVIIGFGIFIAWECDPLLFGKTSASPPQPKYLPPVMQGANWIILIGAVSAMSGWIISAILTVRNSIKQHTINTLLQSRLSVVYMEEAKYLNKTFFSSDTPQAFNPDDHQDPERERKLQAINYILNYLEFIAVGIRYGDLDAGVLKASLRLITINAFKLTHIYIAQQRGDANGQVKYPKRLEHLVWLCKKWKLPGEKLD